MKSFTDRVGEWGEATFPHSTLQSILTHLRTEEIPELEDAITSGDPAAIIEEAVDNVLLLTHLVYRSGGDLWQAALVKHLNNEASKWEYDAERGYSKRVKQTPRIRYVEADTFDVRVPDALQDTAHGFREAVRHIPPPLRRLLRFKYPSLSYQSVRRYEEDGALWWRIRVTADASS